jgi:hypothetical protein
MAKWRIAGVVAGGLILWFNPGCSILEGGPSDEQVREAVRKSPPSPPTLGPTVLTDVASIEIHERGRYNADGRYWPVRVRVRGGARIKVTSLFQFGLAADARNASPETVDFVEEARLAKDNFGNWGISYNYDPARPRWRVDDANRTPTPR